MFGTDIHWQDVSCTPLDLKYSYSPPSPDAKARVSHEATIVQDIQRSVDERILKATNFCRPQGLLEQVYTQHLTKISQWSYAFPSPALVDINVDAPVLETRLRISWTKHSEFLRAITTTKKCKLPFQGKSHDDDWKNSLLTF